MGAPSFYKKEKKPGHKQTGGRLGEKRSPIWAAGRKKKDLREEALEDKR